MSTYLMGAKSIETWMWATGYVLPMVLTEHIRLAGILTGASRASAAQALGIWLRDFPAAALDDLRGRALISS